MYLKGELSRIADALGRQVKRQEDCSLGDGPGTLEPPTQGNQAECPTEFPVDSIARMFDLSSFERDILLLCAGIELDARFASLCAMAQNDARRPYPTFGLALTVFEGAHWSALSSSSPLRHWKLIELESGDPLTTGALRIDERVLHFLAGIAAADERLRGLLVPVSRPPQISPSHCALAERLVRIWKIARETNEPLVVELAGKDRIALRAIASTACAEVGLRLHRLAAEDLPASPVELEGLSRLCNRENALASSALLFEVGGWDAAEAHGSRSRAWCEFLQSHQGLTMVASSGGSRDASNSRVMMEVPELTKAEQRDVWIEALNGQATSLNGDLERLTSHFRLSPAAIRRIVVGATSTLHPSNTPRQRTNELRDALWRTCRAEGSQQLEELAERIEPSASWEDLVLPEAQISVLQQIAIHARQRTRVHENWGFGSRNPRGLGITALFCGESGTGKTLAGEILAAEMNLDLYRIDLSQVVSKYIGETEKNLRRVFDAAEQSGAVLLFDEADALFGKRSDVKDSHDRYANIEVSYLLQRMEAYRGLAILTTNLKDALDPAFMRRIRFVVRFPFPDAQHRAEIWRRSFPAQTPTENLQFDLLARLTVAGGSIRNISINAAFLAVASEEPVRMDHILAAARSECEKLDRPFTRAEVGAWI